MSYSKLRLAVELTDDSTSSGRVHRYNLEFRVQGCCVQIASLIIDES